MQNKLGAVVTVFVWKLGLQLPMQSVPIATDLWVPIPAQAMCTQYNLCDLGQVGDFFDQ